MTATDRQPDHPNLIRGASSDPETAARQRSHLVPGAHKSHGAYAAALREPLEQQYREAQRRLHPRAPDSLINTQSRRLAMAHLFGASVDDHGVILRRRGVDDVSPAARELRLLLEAIDRAAVQLAAYDVSTQHSPEHLELLRARGELPGGDG